MHSSNCFSVVTGTPTLVTLGTIGAIEKLSQGIPSRVSAAAGPLSSVGWLAGAWTDAVERAVATGPSMWSLLPPCAGLLSKLQPWEAGLFLGQSHFLSHIVFFL